jgi:phosphatidylserine/phosphatidylglycerophosphate/cardiolipin synthase-like enzyme
MAGSFDWLPANLGESVSQAVDSVQHSASSLFNGQDDNTSQPRKRQYHASHASFSTGESVGDCGGGEAALPPGATVAVGFSPEGTSEPVVLAAIRDATTGRGEHTLLVAGYEFTSLDIARAVVAAKDSGARVAVVVDPTENQKRASKVAYLVDHGVPVREDHRVEMLHDKYLIVDGETLETGSFNYTVAAASDRHAENAMVLRHVPKLAGCYIGHWKRVWDESSPLNE